MRNVFITARIASIRREYVFWCTVVEKMIGLSSIYVRNVVDVSGWN